MIYLYTLIINFINGLNNLLTILSICEAKTISMLAIYTSLSICELNNSKPLVT